MGKATVSFAAGPDIARLSNFSNDLRGRLVISKIKFDFDAELRDTDADRKTSISFSRQDCALSSK